MLLLLLVNVCMYVVAINSVFATVTTMLHDAIFSQFRKPLSNSLWDKTREAINLTRTSLAQWAQAEA